MADFSLLASPLLASSLLACPWLRFSPSSLLVKSAKRCSAGRVWAFAAALLGGC
jgi:hypothetical protein